MQYTATNHKISWFKREEDQDALDLSPAFQRKPVWTDEQSAYLIDSILNELPIPEIYLRSISAADGSTIHEVIDGQQRIRAVLGFVRNDLVLEGDDITAKWFGKSWDDLTEPEKVKFWNYQIVVRELGQIADGEIRDLFRRLNINAEVLNDQELRHAHYTGEFLKTVERLADDEWLLSRGAVNLKNIRRMEDVEFVSELLVGLMAGPQEKKQTLDGFYEDFDKQFPDRSYWEQIYYDTRELIDNVLGTANVRRWKSRSEFYSLFLAFGDLAIAERKLSNAQRKRLREELESFREKVNQAKKKDNKQSFPNYVHEYADAVSRAATDLARRNTRHHVLQTLIKRAI
jgi:hypothetical protein